MREYLDRVRWWHDDAAPYATIGGLRLWIWAAIMGSYRLRYRWIWRWAVEIHVERIVSESRIRRRLEELRRRPTRYDQ